MSRATHVIAIAGPSGAGKSSLARALVERLPASSLVFALDAYYRDQRDVREELIEVDVPEALDHSRIVADLRLLAAGKPIRQPMYDYATHARLSTERVVEPASFIVIEGLYALYWPDVRALVNTAVFVTLAHDQCLRRRIDRDARERGRSAEAVEALYRRSVQPMYDRHVDPTRVHADLTLDGALPLDDLAGRLVAFVAP